MKKEGWLNREIAKKYFLCFLFYAFCGWIYEMTLELITYPIHEISNRGVLFGPWIPVYGVGAICFVLLFYRFLAHTNLARKLILLPLMFVLCMLVSTLLELVTSYLLEFLTGSFPWTYLHHPWNFEGRIALHASARFALAASWHSIFFNPYSKPDSIAWK